MENALNRRQFLTRTGLAIGASAFLSDSARGTLQEAARKLDSWEAVRSQFNLTPNFIHLSSFFLVSHPAPVREAIERYRRAIDENPIEYFFTNEVKLEAAVLQAAADYLGAQPGDIALTDSTTMGLGLLYSGLRLRPTQDILTTTHDHYSTENSLRLRAERTGTTIRSVPLFQDSARATEDEIVGNIVKSVQPNTRIVALTWVHSNTGMKLPIRKIAGALKEISKDRNEDDRILLCVDGVHGLGIDNIRMNDLGCDFFVAGTHKWMFGPRGTGIVWGHPTAWSGATATIPTFDMATYEMWMNVRPLASVPAGATMTPGGFHSFEHRWALDEAFRFHLSIGKQRIAERIHELNRQLKEGLAAMKKVKLHTPLSSELSAGIVCFEVEGLKAVDVVVRLREKKIVASVTPYKTLYARLAPSILNTPEEIDRTLAVIRGLTGA